MNRFSIIGCCFTLSILAFYQCTNFVESDQSGYQLSKEYCASCHIYPEPSLLDKATWTSYVLPRMGAFLGIYEEGLERATLLERGKDQHVQEATKVYPTDPLLTDLQWRAIKKFYLDQAPDQLMIEKQGQVVFDTTMFKINYPDLYLSPPSTTFVNLKKGLLQFSDANKNIFFQRDLQSGKSQTAKIGEGLVHIQDEENRLLLTMMGDFSPTDAANGYILSLPKRKDGSAKKLIKDLQRPVHSSYADVNGDQLEDIVIAEYGKWTGGLTLFLQQKDGSYLRNKLINRSGAIKSVILDLNDDALPDILALFGQGDEGFVLLENKGDGKFTSRYLLRFPPSMGSSSFILHDWNEDGKQDIVYTAGDNADYPPVLKPYHGVYIFEQQQRGEFEQVEFLALPGAYGAITGDFDQDGDEDIAAISFFPDYNRPKPLEFCLFEKVANTFQPRYVSLNNSGRWLTFDSGDLDGDGDQDLILGSLSFETPGHDNILATWLKKGIPYIVLNNQTIR